MIQFYGCCYINHGTNYFNLWAGSKKILTKAQVYTCAYKCCFMSLWWRGSIPINRKGARWLTLIINLFRLLIASQVIKLITVSKYKKKCWELTRKGINKKNRQLSCGNRCKPDESAGYKFSESGTWWVIGQRNRTSHWIPKEGVCIWWISKSWCVCVLVWMCSCKRCSSETQQLCAWVKGAHAAKSHKLKSVSDLCVSLYFHASTLASSFLFFRCCQTVKDISE